MIEINTHCALFSGMGGFIVATEELGLETIFVNDNDVSFKFNVGGSKTNSSSKILDRWENQTKK